MRRIKYQFESIRIKNATSDLVRRCISHASRIEFSQGRKYSDGHNKFSFCFPMADEDCLGMANAEDCEHWIKCNPLFESSTDPVEDATEPTFNSPE